MWYVMRVIRIQIGYCEWTFARRLFIGMVRCDEVLMWHH